MRVELCFKQPDGGCQKHIRLVVQKVVMVSESTSSVSNVPAVDLDGRKPNAIPLSYSLDDDEFGRVVAEVKDLKATSPNSTAGLPLGIHPAFASGGLRSEFAVKIRQFILRHCGSRNFVRGTQSYKTSWGAGKGGWTVDWNFRGFEAADGQPVPMNIPRVNATVQRVAQDWRSLLDNLGPIAIVESRLYSRAEIDAAIDLTWKIDNPTLSSAVDTDCLQCHAASVLRNQAYSMHTAEPAPSPSQFAVPAGQNASAPLRTALDFVNFGSSTA